MELKPAGKRGVASISLPAKELCFSEDFGEDFGENPDSSIADASTERGVADRGVVSLEG